MTVKNLGLAVALAAVAVPAMAQSNLTIFGRVNTTVEHQKLGNQSSTGLVDNRSRIGFQGTEDLGNGLKAGFILESGFNSDTGTGMNSDGGMSFNRQSEVNLAGSFGMVRLGNFTSESYFAIADAVSMHNHDTGASADQLYAWEMERGPNKIAYRTPTIHSTWMEVAHAFHERTVDSSTPQKNAWDLALNYRYNKFSFGAGYSDNGYGKQMGMRGTYDFGALTVGGYIQHVELTPVNTAKESWNNYRLVAMYRIGNTELHANAGYADRDNNKSAAQWTLGVNHHLSKRTKIYSYYTTVNNSSAAKYGYGINSTFSNAIAGQDFSSFAVGVRHNF